MAMPQAAPQGAAPGQAGPGPQPGGPGGPNPAQAAMSAQGPQGPHKSAPQMSAQQSILMIHQGYEGLMNILTQAPPSAISPEDKQVVNNAVTSFQAMVNQLGKGPQPQNHAGPAQAGPKGPMPAHSNMNAKPAY